MTPGWKLSDVYKTIKLAQPYHTHSSRIHPHTWLTDTELSDRLSDWLEWLTDRQSDWLTDWIREYILAKKWAKCYCRISPRSVVKKGQNRKKGNSIPRTAFSWAENRSFRVKEKCRKMEVFWCYLLKKGRKKEKSGYYEHLYYQTLVSRLSVLQVDGKFDTMQILISSLLRLVLRTCCIGRYTKKSRCYALISTSSDFNQTLGSRLSLLHYSKVR